MTQSNFLIFFFLLSIKIGLYLQVRDIPLMLCFFSFFGQQDLKSSVSSWIISTLTEAAFSSIHKT